MPVACRLGTREPVAGCLPPAACSSDAGFRFPVSVARSPVSRLTRCSPKKMRARFKRSGPSKPRQRPTLPQGCPCSTIGPEELNFRVRDGNGCDLFGIAARKKKDEVRSSARLVSGGQQRALVSAKFVLHCVFPSEDRSLQALGNANGVMALTFSRRASNTGCGACVAPTTKP